MTLREFEEV